MLLWLRRLVLITILTVCRHIQGGTGGKHSLGKLTRGALVTRVVVAFGCRSLRRGRCAWQAKETITLTRPPEGHPPEDSL